MKYTLDLTKLVMKPNRAGLKILERLTGIELDDLAEELDDHTAIAGGLTLRWWTFRENSCGCKTPGKKHLDSKKLCTMCIMCTMCMTFPK
ncbi:MAG: hypothetical protein KAT62_00700 [Desulfuromonadales bacterium]|nr:hypothetical protein [Desulfuromonadales bacterium]